ncbi:MAG: YraN family protein [Oscillospiraceae bacterium]|nr:YraN family protein [Oscillospiraceae bacterium]
MQLSRSETGKLGEELTAYYLQKSGYEILRRNFRIKGGEIDIIARKDGIIAFVEVKTRDISALESGAEAVRSRKRSLIIRASQEYSCRYPHDCQPRFDISEVTVKSGKIVKFSYLDNAFDSSEDMTL